MELVVSGGLGGGSYQEGGILSPLRVHVGLVQTSFEFQVNDNTTSSVG